MIRNKVLAEQALSRQQTPEPEASRVPDASTTVSVIVAVDTLTEPLEQAFETLAGPFRSAGMDFEILFVSGARDPYIAEQVARLSGAGEPARAIELGRKLNDAAVLRVATERARGRILLHFSGRRRVRCEALLELVRAVQDGADVAVAHQWKPAGKRLARLRDRCTRAVLRFVTRCELDDFGAGVHAIRRDVLATVPLYGDSTRFLSVLAVHEGLTVLQIPVASDPKAGRRSDNGPANRLRRTLDLLGLFFLLRFADRPLRFFGSVGGAATVVGMAITFVLTAQRLAGQSLADRPMLLLGVLLIVLGIQAVALGLIGEIIVHLNASQGRPYRLAAALRPVPTGHSMHDRVGAGTAAEQIGPVPDDAD